LKREKESEKRVNQPGRVKKGGSSMDYYRTILQKIAECAREKEFGREKSERKGQYLSGELMT